MAASFDTFLLCEPEGTLDVEHVPHFFPYKLVVHYLVCAAPRVLDVENPSALLLRIIVKTDHQTTVIRSRSDRPALGEDALDLVKLRLRNSLFRFPGIDPAEVKGILQGHGSHL